MKSILPALLAGYLAACTPQREIPAEMVDASLVKIDIIHRYPNVQQKMLTWKAENAGPFVTFEPMTSNLVLGTISKVVIPRYR